MVRSKIMPPAYLGRLGTVSIRVKELLRSTGPGCLTEGEAAAPTSAQ